MGSGDRERTVARKAGAILLAPRHRHQLPLDVVWWHSHYNLAGPVLCRNADPKSRRGLRLDEVIGKYHGDLLTVGAPTWPGAGEHLRREGDYHPLGSGIVGSGPVENPAVTHVS